MRVKPKKQQTTTSNHQENSGIHNAQDMYTKQDKYTHKYAKKAYKIHTYAERIHVHVYIYKPRIHIRTRMRKNTNTKVSHKWYSQNHKKAYQIANRIPDVVAIRGCCSDTGML